MRPALLLPLALAACMPEPEPSGAMTFAENCVACHGVGGDGTGELAAGLDPRPADLTSLSRRFGGEFPMQYVLGVIDGYRRETPHPTAMPEFGAGDLGPTVIVEFEEGIPTPVPERLLELAQYIRTLQD